MSGGAMTHAVLEVASEVADQTIEISDLKACLRDCIYFMEIDIKQGRITPGNVRTALLKRAWALVSKRINREG